MLVEDKAEVGEGLKKEERQVLAWQGRAATPRLLRDGVHASHAQHVECIHTIPVQAHVDLPDHLFLPVR